MRKIKFKKLRKEAITPTRGSRSAAGWDLYCPYDVTIPSNETVMVKTGLAFQIPDGYFGAIYPRSGLATKKGLRLANCVGVVDSDYRGDVGIPIYNDSSEERKILAGDRVAQIIFQPYLKSELKEVKELSKTERGEGGFGHTGR